MYFYLGSCVTGLRDPKFRMYISDATEMAQIDERGEELSYDDFRSVVRGRLLPRRLERSGKGFSFWYEDEVGLVWAYDKKKDVHYFYKSQ